MAELCFHEFRYINCTGQFTPKMKANAVPRLLSSLVWIDSGIAVSQHRLESSWNKMQRNDNFHGIHAWGRPTSSQKPPNVYLSFEHMWSRGQSQTVLRKCTHFLVAMATAFTSCPLSVDNPWLWFIPLGGFTIAIVSGHHHHSFDDNWSQMGFVFPRLLLVSFKMTLWLWNGKHIAFFRGLMQ